MANRARRGRAGGCRPAFDRERHKQRNVVERWFDRLKQWRGIATRYDKAAQFYQAAVTLAALMIWIRTDGRQALEAMIRWAAIGLTTRRRPGGGFP